MGFISFSAKSRNESWNMSKLESHPFYEIYFLTEGTRDYFFSNTFCTVTAPTIIITPPLTSHLTKGGPYKRINIYACSDIFENINIDSLTKKQSPCFLKLDKDKAEELSKLLMVPCSLNATEENAFEYKKAFCLTTILFLKKYATLIEDKELPKVDNNAILDVVKYINNNFNDNISIQTLCDMFFFSRSTLCRKFKAVTNCSINEYILFIRLNHAKDSLSKTNKSISKIAEECGYSSINSFYFLFLKKEGVTPSQYRKTR